VHNTTEPDNSQPPSLEEYAVKVSLNPGYEDAAARLDGGEKLALRFADDKHRPLRLRLKPRVSLH
jgi:hypothetical protein